MPPTTLVGKIASRLKSFGMITVELNKSETDVFNAEKYVYKKLSCTAISSVKPTEIVETVSFYVTLS